MKMKFLTAVVATALLISPAWAQTNLRMLVFTEVSNNPVLGFQVDQIVQLVNKMSNGDMTVELFGPSVVPPGEQLEPVAQGVFDMIYSSPAYHTGTTGVGMLMDIAKTDVDARRKSGVWGAIADYYKANQNLELLMMTAEPGAQIILREPFKDDLSGLKIRSNPSYDPVVEALGGIPVAVYPAEIYTSLEKGVIDGVAFPQFGANSLRFNEVAKVLVRPPFGSTTLLWAANSDVFKRLTPKQQKILMDVGAEVERRAFNQSREDVKKEEQFFLDHGMSIQELSPEQVEAMKAAKIKGTIDLATGRSGKDAQKVLDLMRSQSMVGD